MMLGAVIVLAAFSFIGRSDLAFPGLLCIAMISFAVYSNWKLRSFWWFWTSIGLVAVLHVYLLLRFPWDQENISSVVAVPVGLADFGLVIGFIKLVELICRDTQDSRES